MPYIIPNINDLNRHTFDASGVPYAYLHYKYGGMPLYDGFNNPTMYSGLRPNPELWTGVSGNWYIDNGRLFTRDINANLSFINFPSDKEFFCAISLTIPHTGTRVLLNNSILLQHNKLKSLSTSQYQALMSGMTYTIYFEQIKGLRSLIGVEDGDRIYNTINSLDGDSLFNNLTIDINNPYGGEFYLNHIYYYKSAINSKYAVLDPISNYVFGDRQLYGKRGFEPSDKPTALQVTLNGFSTFTLSKFFEDYHYLSVHGNRIQQVGLPFSQGYFTLEDISTYQYVEFIDHYGYYSGSPLTWYETGSAVVQSGYYVTEPKLKATAYPTRNLYIDDEDITQADPTTFDVTIPIVPHGSFITDLDMYYTNVIRGIDTDGDVFFSTRNNIGLCGGGIRDKLVVPCYANEYVLDIARIAKVTKQYIPTERRMPGYTVIASSELASFIPLTGYFSGFEDGQWWLFNKVTFSGACSDGDMPVASYYISGDLSYLNGTYILPIDYTNIDYMAGMATGSGGGIPYTLVFYGSTNDHRFPDSFGLSINMNNSNFSQSATFYYDNADVGTLELDSGRNQQVTLSYTGDTITVPALRYATRGRVFKYPQTTLKIHSNVLSIRYGTELYNHVYNVHYLYLGPSGHISIYPPSNDSRDGNPDWNVANINYIPFGIAYSPVDNYGAVTGNIVVGCNMSNPQGYMLDSGIDSVLAADTTIKLQPFGSGTYKYEYDGFLYGHWGSNLPYAYVASGQLQYLASGCQFFNKYDTFFSKGLDTVDLPIELPTGYYRLWYNDGGDLTISNSLNINEAVYMGQITITDSVYNKNYNVCKIIHPYHQSSGAKYLSKKSDSEIIFQSGCNVLAHRSISGVPILINTLHMNLNRYQTYILYDKFQAVPPITGNQYAHAVYHTDTRIAFTFDTSPTNTGTRYLPLCSISYISGVYSVIDERVDKTDFVYGVESGFPNYLNVFKDPDMLHVVDVSVIKNSGNITFTVDYPEYHYNSYYMRYDPVGLLGIPYYYYWVSGIRYIEDSLPRQYTMPNITGIYTIYYDNNGEMKIGLGNLTLTTSGNLPLMTFDYGRRTGSVSEDLSYTHSNHNEDFQKMNWSSPITLTQITNPYGGSNGSRDSSNLMRNVTCQITPIY